MGGKTKCTKSGVTVNGVIFSVLQSALMDVFTLRKRDFSWIYLDFAWIFTAGSVIFAWVKPLLSWILVGFIGVRGGDSVCAALFYSRH